MGAVDWKWFLGKPEFSAGVFQKFELLGALNTAKERHIRPALNAAESASFSINTLDAIAPEIQPVSTCIVCYRNDELKWSGPVWTIDETVADGESRVAVTCSGWFQLLMYRLLKCGAVGVGKEGLLNGVGPVQTSTATSQTYAEIESRFILKDLVERTNYDYPTGISIGTLEEDPAKTLWKITYNTLQNIGQAIQQLANTEHGFDFRVDPATLKLNSYYKAVKEGTTVFGRGQDRPNTVFGFNWGPRNLISLQRTIDTSKLLNQMIVSGQNGFFSGHSDESILKYGAFQGTASLSTVSSPTICEAYAEIEVLSRENPVPIYTFTPLPPNIMTASALPAPFEDYDIGDFAYLGAKYGRMVVFKSQSATQPVRIFSMDVGIDDNGNETVTNVQTTYQGTGA